MSSQVTSGQLPCSARMPVPGTTGRSKASAGSITLADIFALLLIGLSPFWLSPAMTAGVFGADALCVANVLPLVTFGIVISTVPSARRSSDKRVRVARILFYCYLFVFGVAFARSIPNLSRFSAVDPNISSNLRSYVSTRFIVPSLMAMQFLYVLRLFRTAEMLVWLFTTISASLFVLSCIVIVAVLSDPAVLNTPLRSGVANLTESILGIHYNGASAPYAIAAPLLTFMALKRRGFWVVNYWLAFVTVLFLESRTALGVFVGASVLTLIICGRARALVAAAPMIGVVAASALGPIVFHIISQGFTHHSGFSLFLFLSGRDQAIWLPLIGEWWSDSSRFWFGAGEHGILSSAMLITGRMLAVGVAHNAYLEFFLDYGIVGLIALLAAATLFLRWAWRTGHRIRSQLYWVLFLCMVSFLVLGFTGHRFLPDSDNMFVFTLAAALVNVARLNRGTAASSTRSASSVPKAS